MKSLVEELLIKCSDETISISGLLRFALLVARKLNLPDFVTWITNELNGYDSIPIPTYRIVQCEVKGFDGNKWLPIYFKTQREAEYFSKFRFSQSIGELERLCESKQIYEIQGSLLTSIERKIRSSLEKDFNIVSEIKSFISSSYVVGIIDKVRTLTLTWALNLEEAGIVGKEMNFSKEEQEKAQTHTTVNCFGDTHIITNKGTVQIQKSTTNSSQSSIEHQYDPKIMTELLGLINQIQEKSELEIFTPEQKLSLIHI